VTSNIGSAMVLKKRSDIHWARKIWHMLGVCIIITLYAVLPIDYARGLGLFACFVLVPLDILRSRWPAFNRNVIGLFKPLMRDHEKEGVAGTTYLFIGVSLVVWIFPREVALLALMFLAFADPIASYFGIRYGRDKIFGHKSLQGSLAAFFVCFAITLIFLSYHQIMPSRLILLSVLGGFIGSIAEAVPLGKLDDNLTLPTVSATLLWIVFNLFGIY
jgi:diacylglycerol kinase (CTP)